MSVDHPALRYYGGKWRVASWILSHFPKHVCYCEPYGGAASVLLRKPLSPLEVYNDLNHYVVTFFRVLRDRPEELIRLIDLTPYSRQEFLEAQEDCPDDLERARRFFVWSWQGRGRAGVKDPSWRFMSRNLRGMTPVDDWLRHDHLWAVAERLKRVQIENDDALRVIERYDTADTLFYVDPPYPLSTRSKRWGKCAYAFEMTDEQHRELSARLHAVQGKVVLSSYPSALYEELYSDWIKVERKAAKDNGIKRAVECLWINRS